MKKIISRLERLDHLINIKGTGSPRELAKKIGISERRVFDDIKFLKELGAPIRYSRTRSSYVYLEEGKMFFQFVAE